MITQRIAEALERANQSRLAAVPRPRRPRKPTQLQQGILYAAADLARYIVQVEDVATLLRRQGLADADCSDLDEMDKEQLRVLRDDLTYPFVASTDLTENHMPSANTPAALIAAADNELDVLRRDADRYRILREHWIRIENGSTVHRAAGLVRWRARIKCNYKLPETPVRKIGLTEQVARPQVAQTS